MTDRERYIALCQQEALALHAQAWWWETSTLGKGWDALIVEEADRVLAAMPYHIARRWGIHALLLPVHTQYQPLSIAPDAPDDIYERLVTALEATCRKNHIAWVQMQGFYPTPFVQALQTQGFTTQERTTYRIDSIPPRETLPASFSENKRRQIRKAVGFELVDLSAEDFYTFHRHCMEAQGKRIDYPEAWAQAVLPEAVRQAQGRLLATRNKDGQLAAAMFLAWDHKRAYYLLPTYDPAYKDSGAMTWLTHEALCLAHEKGLGFDFEGSMTPSIASSYLQFGGQAVVYHRIEKFYHPLLRIIVKLKERL